MSIKGIIRRNIRHPVIRKIIFGLFITMIMLSVVLTVRSIQHSSSLLSSSIPLWAFVLLCVLLVAIIPRMVGRSPRRNGVTSLYRLGNLLPEPFFDSAKADENSLNCVGQKIWDFGNRKEIGNTAIGSHNYKDKILTISRDNTEGRYVIELRRYNYEGDLTHCIASNLAGDNPRIIRVQFKGRAIYGTHDIIVVLKEANGPHWIQSLALNSLTRKWKMMYAEFSIPSKEDLVVDLHTSCVEANTTFQIKDIVVRELTNANQHISKHKRYVEDSLA